MQQYIVIRGARVHNLKNLHLRIPRQKVVVITGPSGSGKSSLAMDTIYAEAQRRYVESLSPYARQFVAELQKPDVDSIEGLSPAIAIEQKTVAKSPRSTVGTITEVYDYMRVLYTRLGQVLCFRCGAPVAAQDVQRIISVVKDLREGTRLQVLAPIVQERKGIYRKELQEMRAEGFLRARIDGQMMDLTKEIKLARYKRHTIEIVIDRLIIKPGLERQLKTAIETALRYSDTVIVNLPEEGRDMAFSRKAVCPRCGISYPEISPMFFSFNSRLGACPACRGLGFEALPEEAEELLEERPCRACKGMRLRPESLAVKLGGLSIGEFARLSVDEALRFLQELKLSRRQQFIAQRVLREVTERLRFLQRVGLGYLTLERPSLTLSGGEAQRIKLATQIGSSLTGVLYVLDEPTIGLHHRDCKRLLQSLGLLKEQGNTVIVVEHDEETIRWADHIVDMGPGAGQEGGRVVAQGSPEEITHHRESLTGKYLRGELEVPLPAKRRKPQGWLHVLGARAFNLKNIDVAIPLGVLLCITGVSGSGKSSLVAEVLYKALHRRLYKAGPRPGPHRAIQGAEQIDRVALVEQAPLGRTPRSNPATYTGVFHYIRQLFSQTTEAKVRGYRVSRFSFNVPGGRCEACKGEGMKKVEMHFLPNVFVPCDVCKAQRYNQETLQVLYKGRNISEVLQMTISEALEFFAHIPPLKQRLQVLEDIGLGYLRLGQPAPTLSGGEAQRLRLSRELGKRATGKTLYILDEPTTGLHLADIERLLAVLNQLVDRGNTVLIIEHHLDVIKSADYVIDLGPEGGERGGWVVATGTPEEVAANRASYTGQALAKKVRIAEVKAV
jgi:excinuclease ABC subunit A